MAYSDFVVKYDPKTDTTEDVAKRILYQTIIKRRLKANKPAVIFISGDSGEGKSFASLRLQEILMEVQGQELTEEFMKAMNVFTPLEYAEKLEQLLHNKELKKANIFCVQEAREVVKAKLWYSFINQAIGDVNALSRKLKRICFIIISQFIRDISNDIRYTLNYYIKVYRPVGKHVRLFINVMWKDDRDIEKPALRKRKISGYLVYPNGRYKRYTPEYLELKKPEKKIADLFDELDFKSKEKIIKQKLDQLIFEIQKDVKIGDEKVEKIIKWYQQHPEQLNLMSKRHRGKWKVIQQFKDMHQLTREETQMFEEKMQSLFKQKDEKEYNNIPIIGVEK